MEKKKKKRKKKRKWSNWDKLEPIWDCWSCTQYQPPPLCFDYVAGQLLMSWCLRLRLPVRNGQMTIDIVVLFNTLVLFFFRIEWLPSLLLTPWSKLLAFPIPNYDQLKICECQGWFLLIIIKKELSTFFFCTVNTKSVNGNSWVISF